MITRGARQAALASVLVLACGQSPRKNPNTLPPDEIGDDAGTGLAGQAGVVDAAAPGAGGSAGVVGGAGATGAAGIGGTTGATIDAGITIGRDANVTVDAIGGAGGKGGTGNPIVYVSGYNVQIRSFRLDLATGALMPGGMGISSRPSFLTWDSSHKFLYAASEQKVAPGRVVAYAVNAADGALTRINDAASGGSVLVHLLMHPSGKWILTAHYLTGEVAVLPVLPTGGVGEPTGAQKGCTTNAHMVVTDPSGKFVFVPCTGPNLVAQYSFDADTGKLTPNNPPTITLAGGPYHMAFHPSGRYAYVMTETGQSVTSYQFDGATGTLSAPETVLATATNAGAQGAHIVVHPSGKFVYGSLRAPDSLAIFSVNADTGRLTLVGNESGAGALKTPRGFDQDPTGNFILAANQNGSSVSVFRINQTDGKLTHVGNTGVFPEPAFVGVMPAP